MPLKILVPSIIHPDRYRGGAATCTKGLLHLLQQSPLYAEIEIIAPVQQPSHYLHQLFSVAKSFISPLPSKAIFMHSRSFARKVKKLLATKKFDLILLNGSDLLWLLDLLPSDTPCILFSHNIEHKLFRMQIDYYLSRFKARKNMHSLLQFLFLRDWQKLKEYEMKGMKQVTNIIFLSIHDMQYSIQNCHQIKSIAVPPLFNYPPSHHHCKKNTKDIHLGFMANFGWWPNRQGLQWFLKEVFPYTGKNIYLHLFGEQSRTVAPPHPRTVAHDFVPDICDIWKICDFMICPILNGGGVNIKFVEAIYNGVPVLATSFATRGLLLPHDPSIIIFDLAEEWCSFLQSPIPQQLRSLCTSSCITNMFKIKSHQNTVQNFISMLL